MDVSDQADFDEGGTSGRTIVAGGKELESGEPLFRDSELFRGHFTNFLICTQLTPIFPAGLVGIEQGRTRAIRNSSNCLL